MSKLRLIQKLKWGNEYSLSYISAAVTAAFLVYNFYIGIQFHAVWNFSIASYYLILLFLRGTILFFEHNWGKDIEAHFQMRERLFRNITSVLLLIDLSLIIPITLMVLSQRPVSITMIPAIAIAAYTTFKVTMAVINFRKSKKSENLSDFALRIINLKDAIVSVLTLQNTMVTVFGDGRSMLKLTAYTSAAMLIGMIVFTIVQIRRAKKLYCNYRAIRL